MTGKKKKAYNPGMDKHIDIEQQLRDAIQSSGLSLYQLGKKSGINDSQLSRFMRGERDLRLQNVVRLCRVLGLHLAPIADAKHDEPTEAERPPPKKTRKRKGD